MTSHTPGPWFVSDGPTGYQHRVYVQDEPVCDVFASRNARLIAAAPDLLSSHGRLLANFRLLLAGKPVRDVAEMYAEAEAAIVKATGATR